MEIIPAVDVLDGRVVRLLEGDYDRVTVYHEDPVAQAAEFIALGAALVHVVDLAGARDGEHDATLWRRIAGGGVPFQVGGGLRDENTAGAALDAGAERVVVGTAAVWDPERMSRILDRCGRERVVAALDVRDGRARGAGWRDEGRSVDDVVDDLVRAGVLRLLVTGIARDGAMAGPDLDLLGRVARRAPEAALIASGGVGSLADIEALQAAGAEAVVVGRALYEGRFSLDEAISIAR